MEETLASIDGGQKTDSNSCCQHSQGADEVGDVVEVLARISLEELKQLLMCATVELDSARAAAKAQSQLHEARVRHLEELLKTTRRERDEAREQCKQWQWRMSQSPIHGNGSSGLSEQRSGVPPLETVSSVRSSLSPLESVSSIRTGVSPVGAVSALRPAVPHLESVSSMTEPTRATLTQVHRKLHEQQQHELKHKPDPVSSVSSMTEPTRATLTEVHRKLQEQQQQQQFEIQQMDIHQLQHQLDLQHQPNNRSQLENGCFERRSPARAHMDFHPKQRQQQLQELKQQLDMQHKDQDQDLQLDIGIVEAQVVDAQNSEAEKRGESNGTSWDEFSSVVHLDIPVSDDPCLILHDSEQMQLEGVPSSQVNSCSPQVLEDLQQRLHQQQEGLHLRLQLQQESDQLLSQMQQRRSTETASLRLHDDAPLHHQLNQHSDVAPISTYMSGTNDSSLTMSVLQHSSWPGVLSSSASSQVSVLPRNLQGISDMDSMPCYMVPELSGSQLPSGLSPGLSKQLLQSSCLTGGSVVASILSPLDNRFKESASASVLLPRHLPEPPEADPQVMLNSLPEKGKLLQAVMQAGPLLQTLLVAGPLPQWRHPPPTMDTEEIPRVSMSSSNVILPTGDHSLGLVSTHGGRDQVLRLSTSNQTSPSQNGLCHSTPSTSVPSVSASIGHSAQNLLLRVPLSNGLGP